MDLVTVFQHLCTINVDPDYNLSIGGYKNQEPIEMH